MGEHIERLLLPALRFILDYIGFDVDDWNVDFNYELWRRNIHHRNLVRLVGSYLVRSRVRRIHFQEQLIGRLDSPNSDTDSIFSFITESFIDDDEDKVWVEEELDNGCVQIRACNRGEMTLDNCTLGAEGGLLLYPPGRTSTPLSLSIMSHHDTQSTAKISVLEDELAKLREQIAMIVVNQEQTSILLHPDRTAESNMLQSPQPDLVRCAPAPPPLPPPPPPLPCLSNRDTVLSPWTPLKPSYSQHQQETSKKDTCNQPATMSDVLKDIGNVKLRSIQRSPGGTPLRRKPLEVNHSDPASLIASALKKKFAHRRIALGSPGTDKENSSPECSPSQNTWDERGKPRRRSTTFDRRKSALCGDSDSGFSTLSPLAERSLR